MFLGLGLSVGSCVAARAADVVVATCGAVVPRGDNGILLADLDCSAAPANEAAVVLDRRASLSLGGFTVTGAANGIAVRCAHSCVVQGPGTITSALPGPGSLGTACIRALSNAGEPPRSQRLMVENLHLSGCGYGAVGRTASPRARLILRNVVADGNDVSFMAARIDAHDVITSGGGTGFLAPTGNVIGVDIHATGHDPAGIVAARMTLADSTVTDNVAFGVQALVGAAKLLRTTVTGSGLYDVLSATPPRVLESTCGTSARWIPPNGIGASWGVCAGN